MPEMTPRAFSFNSPHGACPDCQGLGAVYDFDPARLVPDESLSLAGRRDRAVGERRSRSWFARRSRALSSTFGIDLIVPFRRLPKKIRDVLFFGAAGSGRRTESDPSQEEGRRTAAAKDPFGAGFEGLMPNLRRRYDEGTLARAGEPRAVSRAAPVPDAAPASG